MKQLTLPSGFHIVDDPEVDIEEGWVDILAKYERSVVLEQALRVVWREEEVANRRLQVRALVKYLREREVSPAWSSERASGYDWLSRAHDDGSITFMPTVHTLVGGSSYHGYDMEISDPDRIQAISPQDRYIGNLWLTTNDKPLKAHESVCGKCHLVRARNGACIC